MTNTVLIKRSGTANSVPVAGNLSLGELALNYADGNLFYKNSSGAVTVIASNKFSSVTGNVTANNGIFTTIVNSASFTGGLASVTGNVTGNYFIGNGSQLTGISGGGGSNIANGTSNVTVVSSGGNATVSIGGTSNVAVFATTGEYVTGLISATGNITGGNVSGTALTGTLATAVQTNITSVGTLGALAVSGNVTAGNVTAGSGVSVPSGSVLFNGTTQVLTIPDNAVFEMSGDFTLEAWVYMTSTPSVGAGQGDIITKGASGNFQPYSVYVDTSNAVTLKASSSGSSWDVANAVTFGTITLNTWNHVAVSRSGTALRLFLNGSLNATVTNGSALYNNAFPVGIGGRSDATELFTGYISTARIVKGVAVYTSAFTPATAPLTSTQSANQNGSPSAAITGTSTSLLLNTVNGAGFLTDSSSYNFTVTNTGTATSQSLTPFVNTAGTVTSTYGIFATSVNTASFTGAVVSVTGNVTGNYFVGNGSLLTGISGGGTPTSIVNGTSNVVAASSGNVTVGVAGTPNVAVFATTGEYVTGLISATGNVTANNGMFTNIVNVASHTGGLVSVTGNVTGNYFVGNGSLLTGISGGGGGSNIANGTSNVTIVSSGGNATVSIGGTSNVAVFATTGEYVTGLISATGNVTGGNINASGVVSAVGNITGANVTTSTTILSGSVLFNGTTQYLTLPNSSVPINVSTGDFTVECWFNTNSILNGGAAQTLLFLGGNTSAYATVRLGLDTSGVIFYASVDGTTYAINSGIIGTVVSNTWYHVAVTRATNTFKVFLNGTQVGTNYTQSGTLYAGTLNYVGALNYSAIGTTPFRQMNGYISNMRVVKGVAVYTGNFTPSTTPLTSTQSANVNGTPSTAITGTATGVLLNTVNGAGFLTDSSSYALTVTNVGTATSNAASPTWTGAASGSVTAAYGIFATSVNTASFTGAVVSVTGNVTGNYFVGNGSLLTGIAAGTPSSIVNGTSNVVAASSGNVSVGVAGTPNVAVFATTGEYVTGLISATGNVVANNGMFTNIVNVASHTGGLVSVTGNVTANNGMFTNVVNVASHTGAVVSVTGNITGGNVSGTLLTGTLATATQTNITSVGTLTALAVSGNVTAGNVTAGSGASVPSGSVLFNGSSNYLTVASNAAFSFGTGNFTVEFWFNVQGAGDGAQQHVFQTRDGVNNGILFQYDRTNKNLAVVSDTGLTGLITANNAIVDGTWYHVSAVRSGTTIYFFVNGTQIATTTSAQNFDATTPYISRRYANDGSFHYFNGYISTLRVVKGVAVYTSAFTPATAPLSSTQSANQNGNPSAAITGTSTSLLLNTVNGAGFLTDSSSYNFTVTNFGPATSQALTPFVNTSGTVTSTFGVFTTSVNTASFTGAVVSVTGNVTGNYFVGNGSQLTGIVAGTASSIANGTSNIAIASSSNISMSVAGVADTVLISPGSLTIAGVFAVPKTLSSNAVVAGNTNALLLGPFTLASGYNIVIPDSSTVYVYPP